MEYQFILDKIVNTSKQIFGEELTGIYLHGSLAMGCFHPDKSDIDLILVIKDSVSDGQKRRLMDILVELNETGPRKGLEFSMVTEEACRSREYPTPFELHFSPTHLAWYRSDPEDYIKKMKGTDPDLSAHFMIIRHYGIVLYGRPVEEVFDEVPREFYLKSICSDIESSGEEILENPLYVILNLCRVLGYAEECLILSKKTGGEWGLANVPAAFAPLLREALECYASDREMKPDAEEAESFNKYMRQRIKERKE